MFVLPFGYDETTNRYLSYVEFSMYHAIFSGYHIDINIENIFGDISIPISCDISV